MKEGEYLWKNYPMGAAIAERMRLRKQAVVYDSHAVLEPANRQRKAVCGVKLTSLCMDDSLATHGDWPDCPRCRKRLESMQRRLILW